MTPADEIKRGRDLLRVIVLTWAVVLIGRAAVALDDALGGSVILPTPDGQP